jgi:hypothetical protein
MGEDGQNAGWAPPTMDRNQRTAEGGCAHFLFASLHEIEKHQEEQ